MYTFLPLQHKKSKFEDFFSLQDFFQFLPVEYSVTRRNSEMEILQKSGIWPDNRKHFQGKSLYFHIFDKNVFIIA